MSRQALTSPARLEAYPKTRFFRETAPHASETGPLRPPTPHGTTNSADSASAFSPPVCAPTSSTTAPATAAARPPTGGSSSGATARSPPTRRAGAPGKSSAVSPWARTRLAPAPAAAPCPHCARPSRTISPPDPDAGTARSPTTAAPFTRTSATDSTAGFRSSAGCSVIAGSRQPRAIRTSRATR